MKNTITFFAKCLSLVLFVLFNTNVSSAQTKASTPDNTTVEEPATFPGGDDALQNFITAQTNYPASQAKSKQSGYVIVTAVIGLDGKIMTPKPESEMADAFKAEAVRVVRAMPAWTPAKDNGKKVKVTHAIEFYFAPSMLNSKKELPTIAEVKEEAKEAPQEIEKPKTQVVIIDDGKPSKNALVKQKPSLPAKETELTVKGDANAKPEEIQKANITPAQLTGGMASFNAYLNKNLIYPPVEKDYGFGGEVIVQSLINELGEATEHTILQSAGAPLDKEALRLAKQFPNGNYKPAMRNGKASKGYIQLLVPFKAIAPSDMDPQYNPRISDEDNDARIVPLEAHDTYAEIFSEDDFNKKMLKICKGIKTKDPAVLGITVTIGEDGGYLQPKVITNTGNLDKAKVVAILKQLPKAKPARDNDKPVQSNVFIGFSNYESALGNLE
jgi:outer membrane biosynthesis protein TonB